MGFVVPVVTINSRLGITLSGLSKIFFSCVGTLAPPSAKMSWCLKLNARRVYATCLPRFILLVSLSDALLVVLILKPEIALCSLLISLEEVEQCTFKNSLSMLMSI